MKKFGLLGRKLGHSYSPQIHALIGDYDYKLYEKEPEEVEEFVKSGELKGMNVTIPYKKDVIPFCDRLSSQAKKIGAVNVIIREDDGSLTGHNTDYYGFQYMIKAANADVKGKKAIVLGDGGASLTVQTVLKDLGAKSIGVISLFDDENNYDNLYKHYDAQIIVNATPVGMYPNVNDKIIDLEPFTRCEAVLDLIYNPKKTMLLKQADELCISNANGILMLIAQAKKGAEYFFNKEIDDSIIEKIAEELEVWNFCV